MCPLACAVDRACMTLFLINGRRSTGPVLAIDRSIAINLLGPPASPYNAVFESHTFCSYIYISVDPFPTIAKSVGFHLHYETSFRYQFCKPFIWKVFDKQPISITMFSNSLWWKSKLKVTMTVLARLEKNFIIDFEGLGSYNPDECTHVHIFF